MFNKKMWLIAAAIAVTALIFTLSSVGLLNAGASYNPDDRSMTINGETNARSYDSVVRTYMENAQDIDVIYLSGPGGDGRAMFKTMDFIRRLEVPVVVPVGKGCWSACGLIALSAKDLTIDGLLLLHDARVHRYPMNVTLHDIFQYGRVSGVAASVKLAEFGFTSTFNTELASLTGMSDWLVVSNTSQVSSCLFDPEHKDGLDMFLTPCKLPRHLVMTRTEARTLLLKLKEGRGYDH